MRRSEEHDRLAESLAASHTMSKDFPLGKHWHQLSASEQVKYLEMAWEQLTEETPKHIHYFKDISHLEWMDVYRVLDLFEVTDPCIQHATKKLLVAGGRGAGKDISQDIQEAIDSLERWKTMEKENV